MSTTTEVILLSAALDYKSEVLHLLMSWATCDLLEDADALVSVFSIEVGGENTLQSRGSITVWP